MHEVVAIENNKYIVHSFKAFYSKVYGFYFCVKGNPRFYNFYFFIVILKAAYVTIICYHVNDEISIILF